MGCLRVLGWGSLGGGGGGGVRGVLELKSLVCKRVSELGVFGGLEGFGTEVFGV